jgi:hypothetical protein
MQFGAIAEMVGDTVGYVPYPMAEFRAGRSPATTDAALHFNRDRMLTLLEALTQRMPEAPTCSRRWPSSSRRATRSSARPMVDTPPCRRSIARAH